LAALAALAGPGATSGAEALASICARHGLDGEVRVLEKWLESRND
jgi:hypothetical protein